MDHGDNPSEEADVKTDPLGFGFEVLITYLLPGLLATAAAAFFHGVTPSQLESLLGHAVKAEFLASFALLAVVALLGAATASAQAVIETFVLDRVAAAFVGVTKPKFDEQWSKYVADLPNKRNPYIARVVLFFQFETRMGLAMVVLAASLNTTSEQHAKLALLGGIAFYLIGAMHHYELASMRNESYP
jgi:hypothetical protein